MEKTTIKQLKRDQFFTLNPVEEPKESQVWVRGDYDRSTKKYECSKFEDISHFREFNGDKVVYTDFIF